MKSTQDTLIDRIANAAGSAAPPASVLLYRESDTAGQILVTDEVTSGRVLSITYQLDIVALLVITGAENLRSAIAQFDENDHTADPQACREGSLMRTVVTVRYDDQAKVERVLALVRCAVEQQSRSTAPRRLSLADPDQRPARWTTATVALTRARGMATQAGPGRAGNAARFIASVL
jgi:hypothetical protein